jgi:outer membrane receptor protein involved in Fe transport
MTACYFTDYPRRTAMLGLIAALGVATGPVVADDVVQMPAVEVVGTTPLPGVGLRVDQIPAPVQTAKSPEIVRSNAFELPGFMNRFLGSVYVNDIQGNPFQPDVTYRGYVASPLLGTPQGLSVYMDGVRLNQPFGDVVSWDLIPLTAISSIALQPGSNPLFGLNTLGGALSIQTKDGRSNPGTTLLGFYGQNNRASLQFESGSAWSNGVDAYATGNLFREDGWRDDSPSRVGQIFAKLGWRDPVSSVSLTGAYADNKLTGNGLQEQRFLARDYASVYTKPDNTDNRSLFFNMVGSHALKNDILLSGNAFYRKIKTTTSNGDINDESLDQAVYQPNAAEQAALAAAGYTGFPTSGENASNTPFPSWRCIANALLNDEPNEKCNGLLNSTNTTQSNWGASGQITLSQELAGQPNQFIVGAWYDASSVRFTQSTQFGYLTPQRGVTPVDAFADGTQNSEGAFDGRVDLNGTANTLSFYATDTLTLGNAWNVTLSGRYNRTRINNQDQLNPGGAPGSLDGNYTYSRFNPALGVTWSPTTSVNAYFGYSEGNRAPSSIELGCADPDNPCKLPNAMAGDPPLNQVVAKTWELGVRGGFGPALRWNLGAFRTENHDDILFVADNQSGFGYFRNFGKTRRQGIEAGMSARVADVRFGANYTYLEATYQSTETINGAANSSNDAPAPGLDGNIVIAPGARIPLIPSQLFKAYADWDVTREVSLNLDLVASGGFYARGNENNQHQPDGIYYLGPGKTPGYAVVNLGADWRPAAGLRFFIQVNNLFDTQYYTAAQLGATGFTGSGNFIARPFATPVVDGARPVVSATFYAPGAPRTAWIGVSYTFDTPAR